MDSFKRSQQEHIPLGTKEQILTYLLGFVGICIQTGERARNYISELREPEIQSKISLGITEPFSLPTLRTVFRTIINYGCKPSDL